ncbi:MAG: hypothetical protein GF313_07005 [Caldithrix sp.]|nr:hypothetical protein [Caldithrix sp.]
MVIEKVLSDLKNNPMVLLNPQNLEKLLDEVHIISEKDTLISGYIRILKVDNLYITQETTDKNEIVLRLFRSEKEAKALVDDHLKTYEDMWNGCGCKINYYS